MTDKEIAQAAKLWRRFCVLANAGNSKSLSKDYEFNSVIADLISIYKRYIIQRIANFSKSFNLSGVEFDEVVEERIGDAIIRYKPDPNTNDKGLALHFLTYVCNRSFVYFTWRDMKKRTKSAITFSPLSDLTHES